MNNTELAVITAEKLDRNYPENIEFLDYENNYQLLITVILTAQTTDKQVMKVTPVLFTKYPVPEKLAAADKKDVEEIIESTGFYKIKASNIIKTAGILYKEFNSNVPDTMEELLVLPGVGRKTANVVLGTLFSKPAVIVDTHFKRVVSRLGLTDQKNPDKIEYIIKDLIPQDMQYRFSMTANLHGRKVCHARSPECEKCCLKVSCKYYSLKN